MHHVRIRSLAVYYWQASSSFPLSALPLSVVVEKALTEPADAGSGTHQARYRAEDRLNQAEDGVGVTVWRSDNHRGLTNPRRSSLPGVAATTPQCGNTAIKISTGGISYKTSDNTYSVSPSVGASHTITYGLTITDNRKT